LSQDAEIKSWLESTGRKEFFRMRSRLSKVMVMLFACAVIVVGGAMLVPQTGSAPEPKIAYAHVNGDGTLDAAHSKNVVAIAGGNGLYCFKLGFIPKNAVATIANDPTAPRQGLGFIETALPPTPLFTCEGIPAPDATVSTFEETSIGGGQSAGGWAFYVVWRE
jgi:hypothetical protein